MAEDSNPVDLSNPIEKSLIDELFDAIQPGKPHGIDQMREILNHNPELTNMRSDPGKRHTDISAKTLLERKMYGYLLTQDVLQNLQDGDTKIEDKLSQTPLHVACLLGNDEAVRLLLEQPDIDLNAENGSEETPLGVACRAAQLAIAHLLLQKSKAMKNPGQKIHVDHQDDAFNTPMEYLVRRGVYPVWAKDPSDEDLKDLAKAIVLTSDQDSPKFHRDFEESCMRMALRHGSYWLLKCILDTVPTIGNRALDDDGWRPLHFAVMQGDGEAVKMLLEADADPRLVPEAPGGMSAQAFAHIASDPDIARMIDSFKPTRSQIKFPQDPKGWVLSGGIKQSGGTSDVPKGFELKELSVGDLVERMKKKKNRSTESDPQNVTWYHLPATNSEDIDKHYEDFQRYLGQSDKHFRTLSEEVIKCLLHINDVVGELSTVRRVLEDRSTAWLKMHESGWIQQSPSQTECRWGIANCDPILVRDSSFVNVERVNKGAEAVQKKVWKLQRKR
ncbi:hypothetical protein KJ359_005623 [Pestalotiopsis sp. 9143b]|nr:hypothetical protein KJ359_005623 [Pestalotiopsis sp. 9143b]